MHIYKTIQTVMVCIINGKMIDFPLDMGKQLYVNKIFFVYWIHRI